MANTPDHLIASGYRARREGRLGEAKEIFSEAVQVCREADANPSVLAGSLAGLGQIERDLRNDRAAIECYREAVGIQRGHPDRLRLAHTVRHLADVLREAGLLEEARTGYEEVLEIYRRHPETRALDLANAIRGFALLRGNAGDPEDAKSLWSEARDLYQSCDVKAGVEESERRIAQLAGK